MKACCRIAHYWWMALRIKRHPAGCGACTALSWKSTFTKSACAAVPLKAMPRPKTDSATGPIQGNGEVAAAEFRRYHLRCTDHWHTVGRH